MRERRIGRKNDVLQNKIEILFNGVHQGDKLHQERTIIAEKPGSRECRWVEEETGEKGWRKRNEKMGNQRNDNGIEKLILGGVPGPELAFNA